MCVVVVVIAEDFITSPIGNHMPKCVRISVASLSATPFFFTTIVIVNAACQINRSNTIEGEISFSSFYALWKIPFRSQDKKKKSVGALSTNPIKIFNTHNRFLYDPPEIGAETHKKQHVGCVNGSSSGRDWL